MPELDAETQEFVDNVAAYVAKLSKKRALALLFALHDVCKARLHSK